MALSKVSVIGQRCGVPFFWFMQGKNELNLSQLNFSVKSCKTACKKLTGVGRRFHFTKIKVEYYHLATNWGAKAVWIIKCRSPCSLPSSTALSQMCLFTGCPHKPLSAVEQNWILGESPQLLLGLVWVSKQLPEMFIYYHGQQFNEIYIFGNTGIYDDPAIPFFCLVACDSNSLYYVC